MNEILLINILKIYKNLIQLFLKKTHKRLYIYKVYLAIANLGV